METFLFTSEFAIEGHPDKLYDQVSDAILDACLEQDPESKVACETCTEANMVMVSGEVTTKAQVDYQKIFIDTCRNIGFVSADIEKCVFSVSITQQSDIAQDVHGHPTKKPEKIGAGDQCHVFGYASDETPQLMPFSHVLATRLGLMLTMMRKKKLSVWLRPGGKTQVTMKYKRDGGAVVPIMVHSIRILVPHDESTKKEQIFIDVQENVIRKVIPDEYLKGTKFFLDLLDPVVIGDAGRLTGRKGIINTYGGWGAHGGGSFSGKDPTRTERSGAYMARQAAKSTVASELARRCFVQVSYANGLRGPLSISVDTYKTGRISDEKIFDLIMKKFDFSPASCHLDLKTVRRMRFQKTSSIGHFGMEGPDSPWEKVMCLDPRFPIGAENGVGSTSRQAKKVLVDTVHYQKVSEALVMRLRQHKDTVTRDGTGLLAGMRQRDLIEWYISMQNDSFQYSSLEESAKDVDVVKAIIERLIERDGILITLTDGKEAAEGEEELSARDRRILAVSRSCPY